MLDRLPLRDGIALRILEQLIDPDTGPSHQKVQLAFWYADAFLKISNEPAHENPYGSRT